MRNILENERIEALIPIYKDMSGNCTRIITDKKEYIVEQSIDSCMQNIANYYNINLSFMRNNYGTELGIKNKVPVVINENLIFIQFVCRKVISRNDRASGYINYKFIKGIHTKYNFANIITTSGIELQTLQSTTTLNKILNYARLCEVIYLRKNYNNIKIK